MDFFKNDITILSICLSLMFFNCKEKQTVENKNPVTAEGITFTWDADSTYLNITLSAETTGWIALGLDPDFAMKGANFIIGYVKEDSVYIRDDYGNAATSHESDISGGGKDNVANKNGTEVDGITTISFSVPLDSGDNRDRVLELGKNYKILLAHGENGADNFDSYHKKKISLHIKL